MSAMEKAFWAGVFTGVVCIVTGAVSFIMMVHL